MDVCILAVRTKMHGSFTRAAVMDMFALVHFDSKHLYEV